MSKRLFLIGFLIVILVMIPVTIFLVKQQTKLPSHANPATTLTFIPPSTGITVGQNFKLGVSLNPNGTNVISFVKLVITYDSSVLQLVSPQIEGYSQTFPVVLETPAPTPVCSGTQCTTSIAFSIGTQISNAVKGSIPSTIATIDFQAVSSPDSGSTTVSFGNGTQVLSLASGDSPSENVLSSANPISLTIAPVPTGSTTLIPTDTPTPGGGGGGTGGTGGGTGGTGGSGGTPSPSVTLPTCTTLSADNTSSTSAPLSVLFTTSGSSSVNQISKVTMNFGDGAVQDITTGGGIGTATVNVQATHVYQQEGVFTATATLVDNTGATSDPSTCSQTITVGNPPPVSTSPTTAQQQGGGGGTTKLPPTGPGQTIVGVGIAGIAAVVGGLILFGL